MPGAVSVIGYDDSRLARLTHNDLTTVAQDAGEMARLAVEAVVARLDGDAGARLRPMAPVLDALRQLGVAVNEEGEPGRLPFTMTTRADAATVAPDGDVPEVAVDAAGSSQFLSAALLAAAATTIIVFSAVAGLAVGFGRGRGDRGHAARPDGRQ